MEHSDPDEEGRGRVEHLLNVSGEIVDKSVEHNNEDNQHERQDVCVRPEHDLVSTEVVDLLEIVLEKVETVEEEDELEHEVEQVEDVRGETVEGRVVDLSNSQFLDHYEEDHVVENEGHIGEE